MTAQSYGSPLPQSDRLMYELTVVMVDACRLMSAGQDEAVVALAECVLDGLADLQALLEARWAGRLADLLG